MKQILDTFFQLDFSSIIISIFIILSAIIAAVEIIGKFSEIIGKPVKWIKNKNKDHELLIKTANNLNVLQTKHEEAVRQSMKHDTLIKEDISNLAAVIEEINKKLDVMEEKNDANERAKLKDRIAQAYRKYAETKNWTEMEEEAFRDLIADYELHGGKNSFIHSVCEPESYSWEITDKQ